MNDPILQVWYCTRLPSIIRRSLADTQIQKATFILLQNETDHQTGIRTHGTLPPTIRSGRNLGCDSEEQKQKILVYCWCNYLAKKVQPV